MFGKPDPLIEHLQQEITWLRGQVEQLRAELLAATNPEAHRRTHPNEAPAEAGTPYEDPRSDFRPKFSKEDIRGSFEGS